MGRYMVDLADLRIQQITEFGFVCQVSDDLPGMAAAYAKEELLTVMCYRSAGINVIPDHLQGIIIYRQLP